MSCGVGHRCGLYPVLLCLWCRLVATAPIRSLAWEPPHAAVVAQEIAKRQKKTKKKKNPQMPNAGEGVEKREPSHTVGGKAKWCNHYGEQYGDSLKN